MPSAHRSIVTRNNPSIGPRNRKRCATPLRQRSQRRDDSRRRRSRPAVSPLQSAATPNTAPSRFKKATILSPSTDHLRDPSDVLGRAYRPVPRLLGAVACDARSRESAQWPFDLIPPTEPRSVRRVFGLAAVRCYPGDPSRRMPSTRAPGRTDPEPRWRDRADDVVLHVR